MEYAENGSLRSYLDKVNKEKLLEKTFVHNVIYDVSYGMKELYNKGVRHRDLKADNVLLDRDMIAKVSDFGLLFGLARGSKRTKTLIVKNLKGLRVVPPGL